MGVSKTCAKLVSVVYPVHIAGKARNLLVLSEPSTVRYEIIFHTFIYISTKLLSVLAITL